MIDGFVIKKLVSVFLMLVPGALLLLLILLIARRWWPRLCDSLAIAICLVLIAGSVPPVSNAFVGTLENRFPVLPEAPADTVLILVLGAGHMYEKDRPPNSVLTAIALSRLTEGVRLWKTMPKARLALSGAAFRSPVSHARTMQSMALQLGVSEENIILFEHTRDTEDEINAAIEALSNINASQSASDITANASGRLVIASSAIHLPRAALMLEDHSIAYDMAPTDFLSVDGPWYRPDAFFLNNLDRSIHEWIGMAWYRLRRLLPR
ncbi:MAG: YdcF family protein [Granulosicoccus sp.]|nr:YdcF family protein [Granulosicoccus sp.]